MTQKQYIDKVNTLNRWAFAYYTLNKTLVPDSKYDEVYREVRDVEERYPDMIALFSPTQRIGDKISDAFKKAKHAKKMPSLADMFNEEEVIRWGSDHPKGTMYCCEPKYDGASLNLLYKDGLLSKAISRGNGEEGEDITANMPYILGVPLSIDYTGTVEVRGEVTMFRSDFDEINEWRVENNKDEFANTRNAASGGLRSLESRNVKAYKLRFTPYSLGENELDLHTHTEESEWTLDQGFVNWGTNAFALFDNIGDIVSFYEKMIDERASYPMDLDGMVIKINDRDLQEKLGETNKHPRWACAFKFPAVEKTTIITDIITQVGKTGAITPVALLKPVELSGAVVSRVILHNFDEIERKDIRIGDEVAVIRSGDVIPKITMVITESRDGTETILDRPVVCPSCGDEHLDHSQTVIRCTSATCDAKVKGILKYAVGKKSLNIASLGISTISELVDKKIITTVGELWDISIEQFLTLEGFKITKASKIHGAIHDIVGKIDGYRVLNAFEMSNIGETASKKLVDAFGKRVFEPIANPLSFSELTAIDDIGDESAYSFISFMDENAEIVEDLYNRLEPVFKEDVMLGNAFEGMTFVITGTLSESRGVFKELVLAHGGKVSGSVSKNTSYVLAGEKAGSKESKAIEIGVEVLDESAFRAMLEA